jgi:1-acyl-sn-glycerol-3-phosphate acyltransferase
MDGAKNKGLIYSFICFAVRLFVKRPIITGLDNFVKGRNAMIVANHEGAWGPVVTRAWFPLPSAPWVNGAITKRSECRKFLSGFFFMEQAHIKGWIAKPLGVIVEPLLIHLLRAGDAVPVYFGSAAVAITYKTSLERLRAGHTLMVFPDDESTLQDAHVPDFHDGYLATASLYYKQTEKKLLIYPLCLSSRRNLMALGKPVEFDPESGFQEESRRINDCMLTFIRRNYGSFEEVQHPSFGV